MNRSIWKYGDFLKEGLIKSWSNDDFIKFFKKIFKNAEQIIKYDTFSESHSVLIFLNVSQIDHSDRRKAFKEISNLLRQSGFYSIKPLYLGEFLENDGELKLEFIKKFTEVLNPPRYLFHGSPLILKDKILSRGLIPKSNKLIEEHPDRVYFAKSVESVKNFLKLRHSISKIDSYYFILKIDTKDLNIKFYKDGLSPDFEDFYFTLDNIPNDKIEVVEEINIYEIE